MEEAEKDQALERPDHVLAAQGVDVSITLLGEGVRWLRYRWSPMLRPGVMKEELTALVEMQMRETAVSANPPCIYVMQWHGVRGAISRSLGIYAAWRWESSRRG